jgi:O-antigen/teichoic acid export membrane protein
MTRSARSAWNFLTTLIFSAVTMALALVVTPFLLRELGPARLGASRALMDWSAYLILLELGLNGALLPLLGRALAKEDRAEVKAVMSAGFRAYGLVTIPMAVGALVLAAAVTRLVKVEPSLQGDLRHASVLAALPLLLMPLSPLRALAEANQRGYVLSIFLILQSITVGVSGVLMARGGWGITGQVMAINFGALLFGILVMIDARRTARGLIPRNPLRGDAEQGARIWQLNTPTLINNICGRVGLLTDNIVIGSILSAPMIVPFLMTQRLGQIAQSQLQSVGSASWAGLAQLHARGEQDLFRERFLELNRLVTMLGLTVLTPIVAYNHAFVRLWLGEPSYAGVALTAIAAGNALIIAVGSLWGWLYGGTGRLMLIIPVSVLSAIVNLVVSVGFTWLMAARDPHRAMWGPVLGTAVGMWCVNLPLMPFKLRKHFGIPPGRLLWALGGPLLLGVPYCALLLWLAERRLPLGWVSLALDMACAGLLFGLVCWLVLLSSEDRRRWLLRLRLAAGR